MKNITVYKKSSQYENQYRVSAFDLKESGDTNALHHLLLILRLYNKSSELNQYPCFHLYWRDEDGWLDESAWTD